MTITPITYADEIVLIPTIIIDFKNHGVGFGWLWFGVMIQW